MNCPKCGDKVDMNAGHVCLTGNDRLKERITYLQARIAELEQELKNQVELHNEWLETYRIKLDYIEELERKIKILTTLLKT